MCGKIVRFSFTREINWAESKNLQILIYFLSANFWKQLTKPTEFYKKIRKHSNDITAADKI